VSADQQSPVFDPTEPLCELHAHLGGSVPVHVLWEIAHAQGIALPTKDYWEFADLVRVSVDGVAGLAALDEVYHWCELIQSSPAAVERAVHAMIGGGYRTQRITCVEVRFNPAKRNRGGEWDLDHVILAACRAVDRAGLEYPQVRAGLVLMMDRTFGPALNEVIVDKALRWRDRGVVGVDIGGPRPRPGRWPYHELAPAVAAARAGGLGVTVHCGEEGEPDEIGEVVESLRPHRVGHGVLAAHDPALLRLLRETGTVLELCPTSNLRTKVFSSTTELVEAVVALDAAKLTLTVSTDGPVMMGTSLRDEHDLLVRSGAFSAARARRANADAHASSFCAPVRSPGDSSPRQ
jgi:adenosine deaminase